MILSILLIFPTYYQPMENIEISLCVWVVLKTFHCYFIASNFCAEWSHIATIYICVWGCYNSCRILLDPEQMIGHLCLVQFWHEWLSHKQMKISRYFSPIYLSLGPTHINASLLEGLDKFNSMFREIVSVGYLKAKLLNLLQVWHFDMLFTAFWA